MKPGPATETAATSASFSSSAASAVASERGLVPAGFASTIAALVARSPWLASRGGSTATVARSSPPGKVPPATSASSAASRYTAKRL